MSNPIGNPKPGYDLVIATDGSCSGNPGPGGWAWVEQISGQTQAGGSPSTTNNIMELTAMISALEFAGPEPDLLLRSDSSYVIKAMTEWAPGWRRRGWKKADGKPVLNLELIQRMLELYESRTGRTDVEWVRGHSGDAANEMADSLAVEQTAKFAQN
ncbi:ribonuclease H family protein [Trueperella bialowiezensis]|uniref:Ribonuclease H n=1 Tax=Trueperella bialowiezensis TaxID=312285 RepID=A0A3S4VAP9_9ACTO|nr:ribonuclease H [Trueperella bialowiezensis]VEI13370.1 Ribonuclease HI [Trueperella bialowiezensis]